MRFIKFSSGPEARDPHQWGDVFVRVAMNDENERLEIGVPRDQIALLHAHHYHHQFDPVVRDLFAHYSWIRHPLHDMDGET